MLFKVNHVKKHVVFPGVSIKTDIIVTVVVSRVYVANFSEIRFPLL